MGVFSKKSSTAASPNPSSPSKKKKGILGRLFKKNKRADEPVPLSFDTDPEESASLAFSVKTLPAPGAKRCQGRSVRGKDEKRECQSDHFTIVPTPGKREKQRRRSETSLKGGVSADPSAMFSDTSGTVGPSDDSSSAGESEKNTKGPTNFPQPAEQAQPGREASEGATQSDDAAIKREKPVARKRSSIRQPDLDEKFGMPDWEHPAFAEEESGDKETTVPPKNPNGSNVMGLPDWENPVNQHAAPRTRASFSQGSRPSFAQGTRPTLDQSSQGASFSYGFRPSSVRPSRSRKSFSINSSSNHKDESNAEGSDACEGPQVAKMTVSELRSLPMEDVRAMVAARFVDETQAKGSDAFEHPQAADMTISELRSLPMEDVRAMVAARFVDTQTRANTANANTANGTTATTSLASSEVLSPSTGGTRAPSRKKSERFVPPPNLTALVEREEKSNTLRRRQSEIIPPTALVEIPCVEKEKPRRRRSEHIPPAPLGGVSANSASEGENNNFISRRRQSQRLPRDMAETSRNSVAGFEGLGILASSIEEIEDLDKSSASLELGDLSARGEEGDDAAGQGLDAVPSTETAEKTTKENLEGHRAIAESPEEMDLIREAMQRSKADLMMEAGKPDITHPNDAPRYSYGHGHIGITNIVHKYPNDYDYGDDISTIHDNDDGSLRHGDDGSLRLTVHGDGDGGDDDGSLRMAEAEQEREMIELAMERSLAESHHTHRVIVDTVPDDRSLISVSSIYLNNNPNGNPTRVADPATPGGGNAYRSSGRYGGGGGDNSVGSASHLRSPYVVGRRTDPFASPSPAVRAPSRHRYSCPSAQLQAAITEVEDEEDLSPVALSRQYVTAPRQYGGGGHPHHYHQRRQQQQQQQQQQHQQQQQQQPYQRHRHDDFQVQSSFHQSLTDLDYADGYGDEYLPPTRRHYYPPEQQHVVANRDYDDRDGSRNYDHGDGGYGVPPHHHHHHHHHDTVGWDRGAHAYRRQHSSPPEWNDVPPPTATSSRQHQQYGLEQPYHRHDQVGEYGRDLAMYSGGGSRQSQDFHHYRDAGASVRDGGGVGTVRIVRNGPSPQPMRSPQYVNRNFPMVTATRGTPPPPPTGSELEGPPLPYAPRPGNDELDRRERDMLEAAMRRSMHDT